MDKHIRENEQRHNISYTAENIDYIYQNVHHDTKMGITRSLLDVKNMLGGLSEEQFNNLARYLSYPRGVTIRDQEGYNTMLHGRRVNQLMREIGKNNLDLLGMDLSNVKNWYAAQLKGNAGRYMKTSSLIITFNDLLTTGGHNLSSRISRVNSMTNYKRHRNYTPTDYRQPANTEPQTTDNTPSVSKPTGNSPATNKPTGTTTPKTNKPSSSKTRTPSNAKSSTNIRPRNAVISSAPRATRGL